MLPLKTISSRLCHLSRHTSTFSRASSCINASTLLTSSQLRSPQLLTSNSTLNSSRRLSISSTSPAMSDWKRLLRFIPTSPHPQTPHIGAPEDPTLDIGIEYSQNRPVEVTLWSGSSILSPGQPTSTKATLSKLLTPLDPSEIGTIRCIGLNYRQHAAETGMAEPKKPEVFMKPSTALSDPYPSSTVPLPKITQEHDCGDWESELAVILGRECKNVSPSEAMDCILGYTAANDVSSREPQLSSSQWSYSKSFDGALPLGPCVASAKYYPDPGNFKISGRKNGELMQECGCDDLIFGVGELISYLSRGTTLPVGTTIVTGTPAGVGFTRKPKVSLREGDRFEVVLDVGEEGVVGTLVSHFVNEK